MCFLFWLRTAPWRLEPRTPNLRGLKVDHCRQKPGALCSSYLALHFGKVSAQGSTSGPQAWSTHVVVQGSPTSAISFLVIWGGADITIIEIKHPKNIMHVNQPETNPPPPDSGLWKNCLPRHRFLVPKMLETAAAAGGDRTYPVVLLTLPNPCWSAYGLQLLWIRW